MWNSYDLFQSRRCHFYICVIISFWINDDNGGDCMRMMIITMARHCQKANGGNWCWQAQMIWWQPMPTFPFAMNPRKTTNVWLYLEWPFLKQKNSMAIGQFGVDKLIWFDDNQCQSSHLQSLVLCLSAPFPFIFSMLIFIWQKPK